MPPRFDGEAESVTSYIFTPFQVRQAPYMAGLALLSDKGETRFGSSTSVGSESVPSALHSLHFTLSSGRSVGQTNKRVIKVTVLRIGTEEQPCVFPPVWDTERF